MDTEDGADSGSSSGGNMTTVSQHTFGDKFDKPAFTISIIENMKEEYGLFVWPCSVILAEYVWQQRLQFSGVSVLELGAGTCLPGLVAAKLGLDVTLTDDSNKLEVLDNMRRVCDLNHLNCKVLGLTWGVWDESIFTLKPKLILGADALVYFFLALYLLYSMMQVVNYFCCYGFDLYDYMIFMIIIFFLFLSLLLPCLVSVILYDASGKLLLLLWF
uniref:Methyltransferase-like protein 23 n=1 Tax=Populus davidiana TaxID=266767 RepID=A0A6M2EI57_9ROSI